MSEQRDELLWYLEELEHSIKMLQSCLNDDSRKHSRELQDYWHGRIDSWQDAVRNLDTILFGAKE